MTLALWAQVTVAQSDKLRTKKVKHVLLLSIYGMHAVDLCNCTHGINGANGGDPYGPNLATLTDTGINYVATVSCKPSGSFPGLAALVTGGSPKTIGLYYEVAYDRSLDAPALLTGTGLAAGPCTPYGVPTGTTTDYDQGIELDDTNEILLVAHPGFSARTVAATTTTTQVAPTIVKALGLNPQALDAVRAEGTAVLPEVEAQLDK